MKGLKTKTEKLNKKIRGLRQEENKERKRSGELGNSGNHLQRLDFQMVLTIKTTSKCTLLMNGT